MRTLRIVVCSGALAALAGLLAAQDQGPLNGPGQTVAKPKKPADANGQPADTDQPPIPSQYKRGTDAGSVPLFKSDVDIVTLDVAVIGPNGQFIPQIPSGNFRVLEDNVPQQIRKVDMAQAPLTVALLVEFSNRYQQLYSGAWYQTQQLVWGFASSLKPEDYCAVITYAMKPEILTDFTTDRRKIQEALQQLTIPMWREANMFDAVTDTADRMSAIEGRKAILLITTGIDTFSRLTYDQTRKKLQEAGVPVYSISLMGLQRELAGATPIGFLQADNELNTFAKETGGRAFFPKFPGEYPGVFGDLRQALGTQYVITYSSSNKAHDGGFRKIKVELVDPNGKPLPIKDQKGKPVKYAILTKSGYKAPREVE
ncbi:MAG: VWA domain-containing protein [Bryobacteraceae bacterium]